MNSLDKSITDILDAVQDPCSVAAGRPHGLIEMGLVLGWRIEEGHLTVDMCLTAGDCMMAPHFIEAAKDKLIELPEVHTVKVVIDHNFLWHSDRMKRGSAALSRADITPFALRQAETKRAAAATDTKSG